MKRVLAIIAVVVLIAAPVFAQQAGEQEQRSNWSASTGMGLTADPETFLMNFELEYHLSERFSVGPAMHVGVGGLTVVSPFAYGRYRFDPFSKDDGFFSKISFQGQMGIGLTYYSSLGGNTGMLLNFGGGLDYALSDALSLQSRMLFNVLPVDAGGDNFYYSWEILGFRYRF